VLHVVAECFLFVCQDWLGVRGWGGGGLGLLGRFSSCLLIKLDPHIILVYHLCRGVFHRHFVHVLLFRVEVDGFITCFATITLLALDCLAMKHFRIGQDLLQARRCRRCCHVLQLALSLGIDQACRSSTMHSFLLLVEASNSSSSW